MMETILRMIDSISEGTGKAIRWLCVALILVFVYDIAARYVFNAPTVWGYETSSMLGGTIYVMGWAYVHRHKGHIRVDVFYTHLSPRRRALIDVVCALLFLFPVLIILIDVSVSYMWRAWLINEVMQETFWYPPAGPFRTMIVIGLSLFALQCVAQFIRDSYLLIRNEPL